MVLMGTVSLCFFHPSVVHTYDKQCIYVFRYHILEKYKINFGNEFYTTSCVKIKEYKNTSK